MGFFNLKFLVSFFYCSISFTIYTLLIIMLLRNWKEFKSAFFHIVIADYFFNLLTWLNSMITLRLPNGTCKNCVLSGLFESLGKNNQYTGGFLFFCYFLHFGNAYFQYSMVTMMSLNRTTSIFFYFVNEKIWQFLFPLSLGTVVFLAVYFTRTILQTDPYFVYNEASDMYIIKADSDILSAYSNVINFMAVSVILSIFFNTISVLKLKLMTVQNLSTIERNLLFSTIASSLVQCAAAGNTFLLQLDQSRTTVLGQLGQLLLPFFSDFLTISQPYILIFLSSKVRMEMVKMYVGNNAKVNSMLLMKSLEKKMGFFNLKFLVSFFYCSISFTIYTLLIIMLLRNWKEFKSAFFHIVIADYFFNLLTWLNSMITLRLPNGTCKNCVLSGLFDSLGKNNQYTGGFLFFCYFLHFGNAYFQYGMITMMSLNRATSIFYYFLNEKIWKYLLPILLIVIIAVTTFGTRTILSTVPYYTYNEALDMYTIKSDSNILPAYYNVIYFMAFAVSCSVVLNIISVIRLKMIQSKISTVERNLLLVTIFSSVIQCFAAANTFVLQIDVNRSTMLGQMAQVILPFASDFLTISQPYVLIFLSSKVRSGFMQMYLQKWNRSGKITSIGFSKTGVSQSGAASRSSQITRF